MKKETFELAQELNNKIEDLDSTINDIESNRDIHGRKVLNFSSFIYDEEEQDIKNSILKLLEARRNKYQKQFDNLK